MTRGYIKAYKEAGLPVDSSLLVDWPQANDTIDNQFKDKFTAILKKKHHVNGLVASDILIYKYRKVCTKRIERCRRIFNCKH